MHIGKYRGAKIVIKTADITDEECDAIIIPMNCEGKMMGGTSLAVKKAGGDEIERELQRQTSLQVGKAFVTGAGGLKARHVIHAMIMEKATVSFTSAKIIERAIRAALYCAQELGCESVSLPGFGTGFGQMHVSEAASTMIGTLKTYIEKFPTIRGSQKPKEIRIVDNSGAFSPQCIKHFDILFGWETKPAVVVIDMIKDFIHQEGGFVDSSQRKSLLQNINLLISCARKNNIPIVFIADRHQAEDDKEFSRTRPHALVTTSGSQLIDDLDTKPDDLVIPKTRYSAFFDTDLQPRLQKSDVNTLLLCGVQSHVCVLQTALDAFYRGYRVIVVRDCVSSSTRQKRDMGLKYIEDYVGETTTLDYAETIIEN